MKNEVALAASGTDATGAPPGVSATRSCTPVSEPAGLFRFQESEALRSLIAAANPLGRPASGSDDNGHWVREWPPERPCGASDLQDVGSRRHSRVVGPVPLPTSIGPSWPPPTSARSS